MTQPLVSILIPLYNAEKWISETIHSALTQTWSNREIIIVDDGSTDNSLEIAKKYKTKRLKVFSQSNRGGSSARNKAFELSKGDYIQYLDADDIIAPDKVEVQAKQLMEENECSIASGSFYEFTTNIINGKLSRNDGYTNYAMPIDWLIDSARGRAMFPPIVWLIPRKLIELVGPWNEQLSYNDDSEFFARIILKSRKIIFCESAKSFYRRGIPTSVGSQKTKNALISRLLSLRLVSQHMINAEDSFRVRYACATEYQRFIFSVYPENIKLVKSARMELEKLGVEGNTNFAKGKFKLLSKIFGFKTAKWIRHFYKKI